MAVILNATCILLKTKLSIGKLLVEGKTWTDSEEKYADQCVANTSPHCE